MVAYIQVKSRGNRSTHRLKSVCFSGIGGINSAGNNLKCFEGFQNHCTVSAHFYLDIENGIKATHACPYLPIPCSPLKCIPRHCCFTRGCTRLEGDSG